MVGKLDTKGLDKVERPPDYRVESTVETHDQSGQKGGEERKEEDEYSASSGVKGWQKYRTEARDRRPLKFRRKDIAKIFINQVFLQKGLIIIDADLQLINGQILKNTHLFSSRIDLYWKLRKLGRGEEFPVGEMIREEYVEVSALHQGSVVRSAAGAPAPAETQTSYKTAKGPEGPKIWAPWPLKDKGGRPNWAAITIYAAIAAFIIFIVLLML